MIKLIGFRADGQASVRALAGLQLAVSLAAFGGEPRARLERGFGQLPLAFERNEGQAPPWVEFVARGPGYLVALSRGEAVLVFAGASGKSKQIRMKLSGSAGTPAARASDRLPGLSHYFPGRDPATWRTNVQQFGRVTFDNLYSGVSATYYGNQGQLEYDFVVAPGADASRIELEFEGAAALRLDPDGDVVLPLGDADARLHAPLVYQQTGGGRRSLRGRHVVRGNRVRFEVEGHDARYPLVIDPVLSYSTTLGGSGTGRPSYNDLAVDAEGNTYVAGCAALGMTMLTPYLENLTSQDVFIAKLSADGTTLLYSTYLGAGCASAIALDPEGNIVVAGTTSSTVFPLRHPAYSRTGNSFLAKLRADGSELIYSTYLEGNATDVIGGVATDRDGNALVTRTTGFSGLRATVTLPPIPAPETSAASPRIGVIQKFGPEGALLYTAALGRGVTANGVATDASGAAYVAGATCGDLAPLGAAGLAAVPKDCDGYLAKLPPDAASFEFVNRIGGSGWDGATHVAVDAEGNAYITGTTFSADFPVTAAAPQKALGGPMDVFVAKLNTSGDAVVYATYLGGSREESPSGIGVDGAGQATVAGTTTSSDFPVAGALRPLKSGTAVPLHLSDTAGQEWTAIAPGAGDPRPWQGSIMALAAAPGDPRTVYAVDQAQVAGRAPVGFSLYRSPDAGRDWTTAYTEAGNETVYGLAVRPDSAAGVYLATSTG
ncbi:MAG: SBBP repeat-containing protein, partial [Acidobacteriota bacterium]